MSNPFPKDTILHQRPWLAPSGLALGTAASLAVILQAGKTLPGVERWLISLSRHDRAWFWCSIGAAVLLLVFGALEQVRRMSTRDPLPFYLRLNRALVYGLLFGMGLLGKQVADTPETWRNLLLSPSDQLRGLAVVLGASFCAYWLLIHPFKRAVAEKALPLPVVIADQRNSFDFTIGMRFDDDWEKAEKGQGAWANWPEAGLYGNLLCLGQIGSGKTSQVADPLVLQALGKYPDNDELRPSLVVLDLKGNQSARYYQWAKALGRASEFKVLRPDHVKSPTGDLLIPEENYCTFNALSGWEHTDLLAIEFVDALESTKRRPSPDYFVDVQQEFLTHALRIITASCEGEVDLADVAAFASAPENRDAMIDGAQNAASEELVESSIYFKEEFGQLDRQQQASLLRGLAAKLTLLTNQAVQAAFCPKRGVDKRQRFGGWADDILEKPGILVFSCPPAQYTDALSRLLGLLVLKSFQQAMLRRTDAGFRGNRKRPVIMVADEAHAFVNQRLGDFMSVSREARVSSWLLTQSTDQIPDHYRGTVLSNTRTRVLLQVSGETATLMSRELGSVKEQKEQISFGESLQDAHDAVLLERKVGQRKSVSANRAIVEKERPRWSPDAIQHLRPFRGVLHMFDGQTQHASELIMTIPWYRLPFYVLDPRNHPNVKCSEAPRHDYAPLAKGLRCKLCGHILEAGWQTEDYKTSRAALAKLRDAA